MNNFLVENANSAGCYRAHGEFFVTGNAEFANDENVEHGIEFFDNFKSNRNTAARQRQHQKRWIIAVMNEFFREKLSGVHAILK